LDAKDIRIITVALEGIENIPLNPPISGYLLLILPPLRRSLLLPHLPPCRLSGIKLSRPRV